MRVGGVDVSFKNVEINSSGFAVQIPLIDTQLTSELIEVDFRAEVFAIGTLFSGPVLHSERPYEVPQGLTPGDADPLADGDRLQVDLIGLKSRAIQAMRLSGAVFTPNGDGVNDIFYIQGGEKVEKVTTMRVFDRWGDLVFEGTGMEINDIQNGWDGTFKGKPCTSGAYVWYAEVLFKDGETKVLRGDVILLR